MARLLALLFAIALAMTPEIPASAADPSANVGVAILRGDSDFRLLMAPGQTIRLAIAVNNLRGTADAPDTTLTLALPDGLTAGTAVPPARKSGKALSWVMGTLPAGSTPRFVELDLTASPKLAVGAAPEILASVTTHAAEVDLDNNRDVMPIRIVTEAANLVLRSTLDHMPIFKGEETVAAILVSNNGVVAATSSAVTMMLPNHVTLVSAEPPTDASDGKTVRW